MSFDALQQRVSAVVAAQLLTDSATLNGVAVKGKFDNGNATALSVMNGTNPTFVCLDGDVGIDARGQSLVVNAVVYVVRETKPDGMGFTLLELEQA